MSGRSGIHRRDFLCAGAGVAATAVLAPGIASTAAAQSDSSTSTAPRQTFDGWLDGVGDYDGVVDLRGRAIAVVEVGAEANGGAFGFGPAAVQIDPGTTVRWTWTGDGGSHNVAAADGSFASDLQSEAGATFEQKIEDEGVVRYSCEPHAPMGMRGVVVVGDVPGVEASTDAAADVADPAAIYGDWFDDVDNFAGTVDERGKDLVTVAVGASGNGGSFAFDPAAVQVDPGTTVRFEWTGQGGVHNVVAADGSFTSELSGDRGHTFEITPEKRGIVKYACRPHVSLGMKGAVLVGDEPDGSLFPGVTGPELFGGGLLMALLSPLAFGAFLRFHGTHEESPTGGVTYRPSK